MIYVLLAVFVFTADLFIKNHMEKNLPAEDSPQSGAPGIVYFRKHHNRGAFLNAGEKRRPLVAVISLLLTLYLTVLFIVSLGARGNAALKTGLALLLGGAFSNTYDRLKRKYVVDYISFRVPFRWLSRMIFNMSDFCIMIGALVAALSAGDRRF